MEILSADRKNTFQLSDSFLKRSIFVKVSVRLKPILGAAEWEVDTYWKQIFMTEVREFNFR